MDSEKVFAYKRKILTVTFKFFKVGFQGSLSLVLVCYLQKKELKVIILNGKTFKTFLLRREKNKCTMYHLS